MSLDAATISLKKQIKILKAVFMTYSSLRNKFQATVDFVFRKKKVFIVLRDGARLSLPRELFFQLVFVAYMRQLYPVRSEQGKIILNNGFMISPDSCDIFLEMLLNKGWQLEGDVIKKNDITFFKCMGTNSIYEIFEEHLYEAEVFGKTVVDIGAGVGDSAIWFASKGARVIAFEPNIQAYQYALANLDLNSHLKDRVKLHNAAVEPKDSYLTCSNQPRERHSAPRVTLSEILNGISDPFLLKIDCEGCEFPLVMLDWEHVCLFQQIIIEYHPNMTRIPLKRLRPKLEKKYTCERIIGDELLGVLKCIKKVHDPRRL